MNQTYTKPLVSIITPTYNHEKFIGQCIESVLNQTFNDWEMLIVDDASTDKTGDIASAYCKKDPRIKVIQHRANYGPGKLGMTHNEALTAANGLYIAVLEGDDFWPDYRLEAQLKSFEGGDDIVLSHGWIIIVNEGISTDCRNPYPARIRSNDPKGAALEAFLMGENPLFAPSIMVRKDTLLRIGGFQQIPSLYLVDYPTWMNISLEGRFNYIDRPLGYWRRHPDSITGVYQEKLWLGFIDYTKDFISKHGCGLLSMYPDFKVYIDNHSYNAFQSLCVMYLLSGKRGQAKLMLKELLKRKSIVLREKRLLVLLILIASIYSTPSVYKLAKKISELLRA